MVINQSYLHRCASLDTLTTRIHIPIATINACISCSFQSIESTLKISRASQTFLLDKVGQQYGKTVSRFDSETLHVVACHPSKGGYMYEDYRHSQSKRWCWQNINGCEPGGSTQQSRAESVVSGHGSAKLAY